MPAVVTGRHFVLILLYLVRIASSAGKMSECIGAKIGRIKCQSGEIIQNIRVYMIATCSDAPRKGCLIRQSEQEVPWSCDGQATCGWNTEVGDRACASNNTAINNAPFLVEFECHNSPIVAVFGITLAVAAFCFFIIAAIALWIRERKVTRLRKYGQLRESPHSIKAGSRSNLASEAASDNASVRVDNTYVNINELNADSTQQPVAITTTTDDEVVANTEMSYKQTMGTFKPTSNEHEENEEMTSPKPDVEYANTGSGALEEDGGFDPLYSDCSFARRPIIEDNETTDERATDGYLNTQIIEKDSSLQENPNTPETVSPTSSNQNVGQPENIEDLYATVDRSKSRKGSTDQSQEKRISRNSSSGKENRISQNSSTGQANRVSQISNTSQDNRFSQISGENPGQTESENDLDSFDRTSSTKTSNRNSTNSDVTATQVAPPSPPPPPPPPPPDDDGDEKASKRRAFRDIRAMFDSAGELSGSRSRPDHIHAELEIISKSSTGLRPSEIKREHRAELPMIDRIIAENR